MANVLNYGAVPDGVTDCTAAVQAAIAATPFSGTVCFPVSVAGFTYRIQADTIDAAGRRFQGDLAHASQRSTLLAGTAGTSLLRGTAECAVASLALNPNSLTQYGLRLTNASRSLVENVEIANATLWGLSIEGGESLYFEQIFVHDCLNGIRIIGGDGSEFYDCSSNTNTNIGVSLAAGGGQVGSIKWFGGQWDVNVAGPQLLVDGAEGAQFTGVYVEGQSPGVLIQGAAQNNLFEHLRFVNADAITDFAIRVNSGNKNTFIGCAGSGTNGRRIFLDAVNAVGNQAIGCFRGSVLAVDYMTLWYDNGAGTVWQATQRQAGLVSEAGNAPTTGTWAIGDVVWNNIAGAPTGWRCTVAGTPGTWTAF